MHLIGLAGVMIRRKDNVQALNVARQALVAAAGDPEAAFLARRLLGSLVPRYHFPMMNDTRRNLVWDAALRNAIRPGMHVLEIGTGGGMLALIAARAGADRVTTCEIDSVLAELATEVAARNSYGNVINVIAKKSQDLYLGVDLDRPADLLICDIFADDLLGFDPLPALVDARRLLTSGARVVPEAGAIRVALGRWDGYARQQAGSAAGFDISPFADLTPNSIRLRVGYPDVEVLSVEADLFGFRFDADYHPPSSRVEVELEAHADGEVNGILQWIRLRLDADRALEARPQPGAIFFSSPYFYPLPGPVAMRRGDRMKVAATYTGSQFSLWPL
jgi:type II protein arginine methyltransferase